MEKLQRAIEQARKERYGIAHRVRDTAVPAPGGKPPVGDWGAIPEAPRDEALLIRNRVMSFQSDASSSPFDVLRTKILQQMQQNNWRRLLITSPTPECGKSTLAANLAYGLARQGEYSGVLMELDLRRPSLAKSLGLPPRNDVRDLLSGEVSFEEQGQRIGKRMALCLASRPSNDPTRYLTSQTTRDVINKIEETYQPDIVIFDMPPLLVNDDTRAFLPLVDCALLVAKAERSTAQQIDVCEREISERTNTLGVVLNQYRFFDDTQYYGYGGY